jgi:hypothetical protein
MTAATLSTVPVDARSRWDGLLANVPVAAGVFPPLGAVATWGAWTSWYSLAIITVTLPSAWLGGRLSLTAAK